MVKVVVNTKILDGKWLAEQYQRQISSQVGELTAKFPRPPGLGVILVGNNPASLAYVGNKEKSARRCGFVTFDHKLKAEASLLEVEEAIFDFNSNDKVDGILLQLPLPKHLDSTKLLDLISPDKDADGLHPLNQGLLMRGNTRIKPCTPLGILKLIDLFYSGIESSAESAFQGELPEADLSGKTAIVIGRSVLVGKPISLLLQERNATVFMAHSKTKDLAGLCKMADIVVAAVGVAKMVQANWLKSGALVIDVGMNRLETGKLTGDVDFDACKGLCAGITPVPGGVGPMTVTMLIYNTFNAYKIRMNSGN